jgi:cytochrome P450
VDLRHVLSYSIFRLTRVALGIPLPIDMFDEVLGAEQLLLEGFRDDTDPGRREKFWQKFDRVSTAVGECLRAGSYDESGLIGPILAGPRDDDLAFRHQLAIFFLAGPMNGAHEILWTLLLLQAHPDWAARVRAEAARAAAQGLSVADSGDLYAAVLEAERLRPPVSVSVRVAGADFDFAGYDVPKGTRLIHPTTLVHFLDEMYEHPLEYRPERQFGARYPPRLHASFGLGTHRCVGMPLARQQVLVALSELLLSWDIEMLFRPSLSYVLRENVTPRLKRLPARIVRA